MSRRESDQIPALSLVATPTKRAAMLDLAIEAERIGVSGIACPSLGGTMGLCTSLAHVTSSIRFWTSIQPMYYSHPVEAGNAAAHIHEVSHGRFGFGIGVSHTAVTKRLGVETGKPLTDIDTYVAAMRANERFSGALPPIYLATEARELLDNEDLTLLPDESTSNTYLETDPVERITVTADPLDQPDDGDISANTVFERLT
jgi:hypothetical protein